ncbi:MAG TPA: tetratricopeptide repeat protein [Chthoniobacterales bacterium]|nr:tetratricopeptide repeat protein [Chthoniobacterales bacterium]
MMLVSQVGDDEIDRAIRSLQEQIRVKPEADGVIKRLGWKFVTKARLSCDPGYYRLAEACAQCVRARRSDDPDALLLEGHVLQSLHRFKEGERVARRLVEVRKESADFGLLGDQLMEQGRLDDATSAYQKMVDLRPDLESYMRVAHLRWLKGDLEGAIEVTRMAVAGGSPLEPEPTAWAYTRLGIYQLQTGNTEAAAASADLALQFCRNYAPGLLVRGKILLVSGNLGSAIDSLRRAATMNPMPEYQWILADALRAGARWTEAEEVEASLMRNGEINDPRTFSLFLASRGKEIEHAVELATAELSTRADVFTMDAVAWALAANGRLAEARQYSQRALNEGTQDARLFYHAGSIAKTIGQESEARAFFLRANQFKQSLTPSERDDFNKQFAAVRDLGTSGSSVRSN